MRQGLRLARRPSPSLIVATVALVVCCAGSATAASLITGKQVKNDSLTGADIRDGSLDGSDIDRGLRNDLRGRNGARGPTGPPGPAGGQGQAGPQGPAGPAGAPATFSGERWGVIARNVYGSPVAELRLGPWGRAPGADAATEQPPYGVGSLGLAVNDQATGEPLEDAEKISFGNESDFAGLRIADIAELGFSVFATAEGSDDPNAVTMPNIALEVDPDVSNGGTPVNYTSLVYLPPAPDATNRWQAYDATAEGTWFASGTGGTVLGCTGASPCSFDELADALGADAKVTLSVAVAMGRDGTFVGAIDGLRIKGAIYDFEPLGVRKLTS